MTEDDRAGSVSLGSMKGPEPRPRARAGLAILACLIGIGLPLAAQTLNIVTLDGFPLGFYVAAQGAPLLLAMLVAWHALASGRRAAQAAAFARERFDDAQH